MSSLPTPSGGGHRRPRPWPFHSHAYIPHLENGYAIKQNSELFESSILSTETSVRIISIDSRNHTNDELFDADQLELYLKQQNRNVMSEVLFVNRYLVKEGLPWPADSNKLRLSAPAFQSLRSHFQMSPSFIASLTNFTKPSGRGCPCASQISKSIFDFWMIIPIRVQVPCSGQRNGHISSAAGTNQMNPLNYLHLGQPEAVDIRGSQIAIYFLFNADINMSSTLVLNFQDGRWKKVVEEPILRVKEALEEGRKISCAQDPFRIQSVVLTSALRWWNNALSSFNDQLIAYEETLLTEEEPSNGTRTQLNSETNRALHCMAAHLYRYGSELASLSETVQDIKQYHTDFHQLYVERGIRTAESFESLIRGLAQITTQLSSIARFRDELQLKTANVLSLLVDNTQIANERLLVQNSQAMQTILQATQVEMKMSSRVALQTQRLSKEMMKDSVAMKSIALLTTVFLPGTSFAAVLAMPFLSNDPWMQSVGKFWLWVLLTVPTTLLCFTFFFIWSRRETIRKERDTDKEIGDELMDINGAFVESST